MRWARRLWCRLWGHRWGAPYEVPPRIRPDVDGDVIIDFVPGVLWQYCDRCGAGLAMTAPINEREQLERIKDRVWAVTGVRITDEMARDCLPTVRSSESECNVVRSRPLKSVSAGSSPATLTTASEWCCSACGWQGDPEVYDDGWEDGYPPNVGCPNCGHWEC